MDLSIIINEFEQLSTFSAGIERLSGFYEAMREVDDQRHPTSPLLQVARAAPVTAMGVMDSDRNLTAAANGLSPMDNNSGRSYSDNDNGLDGSNEEIDLQRWRSSDSFSTVLQIQNMDLATPDRKRVLIRNLNVELLQGQHLLIVGDSGTGKSSLLRAIAGLWTAGRGTIGRPADGDVYFLPQRPYCTTGSLKDQLLYPSLDCFGDEEMMDGSAGKNRDRGAAGQANTDPRSHWLQHALTTPELLLILEKINLLDVAVRAGDGDPAAGLAAVMDWSNILSLGEQQRLAFGRLLVNRPRLVIVDEATSALDLASEALMYSILREMALPTARLSNRDDDDDCAAARPGLTYISVGHRPSLVAFHDKKLRLGGELDHELSDI